MTRVLVCGGRDFCGFDAAESVFKTLDAIDAETRIELIIEGGQRTYDERDALIGGADLHACRWSYSRARPGLRFDADWRSFGRAAGPIRNQRMIDEGRPDLVVAFPGGKGTEDMRKRARLAGIKVVEAGK